MGLSPEMARNWEEMQDGFNSGWIDFGRSGTESVSSITSPAQVFAAAARRKRLEQRPSSEAGDHVNAEPRSR